MQTNSVSFSSNSSKYENPSVGKIALGILAGSLASGLLHTGEKYGAEKLTESGVKLSKGLSQDELTKINSVITNVMEDSGLSKNGVEVVKVTKEMLEDAIKTLAKTYDEVPSLKIAPTEIKTEKAKAILSTITCNNNAFYTLWGKKIFVNDKNATAFFHEAGHAINSQFSTFFKVLQKSRTIPTSLITVPIGLIALFKTKKTPDEKPSGKLDKITTFIKENAGKLTFLAFIPTLLEESMATIRGNAYAKKLLPNDLAKKVCKFNIKGTSTYFTFALASSVGIFVATKIKDAIAKPKLKPQMPAITANYKLQTHQA